MRCKWAKEIGTKMNVRMARHFVYDIRYIWMWTHTRTRKTHTHLQLYNKTHGNNNKKSVTRTNGIAKLQKLTDDWTRRNRPIVRAFHYAKYDGCVSNFLLGTIDTSCWKQQQRKKWKKTNKMWMKGHKEKQLFVGVCKYIWDSIDNNVVEVV